MRRSRITRIAVVAGVGLSSVTGIEVHAASVPDTSHVASQSSASTATPAQPTEDNALTAQIRLIIDAIRMGQLGTTSADRTELIKALEALRKNAAESETVLSMMKRDRRALEQEVEALRAMSAQAGEASRRQREFATLTESSAELERELSSTRESVSQLTAELTRTREQSAQLFHELQLLAHTSAQLAEERDALRRLAATETPRKELGTIGSAREQALANPQPGRGAPEAGAAKPEGPWTVRVPVDVEPTHPTPHPLASQLMTTTPSPASVERAAGASRSASGEPSPIIPGSRSKVVRPSPAQQGLPLKIHSVNEELGLVIFDVRGTDWAQTGARLLLDAGTPAVLEVTIDEVNPNGLALAHIHGESPHPLPIKPGDRVLAHPQLGP